MTSVLAQTSRKKGALACIAALPLLAACYYPGVEMTAIPIRIDYVCASNKTLPVARREDQRTAAILIDGKEYVLSRADSAAQEKYSDGRYSLYLEGERAMLEDQGRVLYGPCVSPVPLPTYFR